MQRRKDAKKKRRKEEEGWGMRDGGWQRISVKIALEIAVRIQVGRLGVKELF